MVHIKGFLKSYIKGIHFDFCNPAFTILSSLWNSFSQVNVTPLEHHLGGLCRDGSLLL